MSPTRTSLPIFFGLFFIFQSVSGQIPSRDELEKKGFVSLINGDDLSGWHGCKQIDPRKWGDVSQEDRAKWNEDRDAHWKVENGVIINDGHGVFLTTDEDYGDIELFIEYRTVPKADSGIYLRGTPQVQIWDSTNESVKALGADKGSGGLWNNAAGAPGKDPMVLADKPFGEWNSFRIVQVGSRTSIWLNGKQVVDHAIMHNFWDRSLPLFASGPIQLQTHGGEIAWRNIYVRRIGSEEANAWLSKREEGQYVKAFDGKTLSGWTGAVDSYEVVDGTIRCKPSKGGVLHTKDEFSDFDVQLEFKLPPGGNNGLAIRYPGEGDTAYKGMCELQVLDNTASKYANLDERQYHGSAYGMIAAHRGYLRPVGEWNYQHVEVRGSRIRVELNGTVILDGDLGAVKQFLADRPHPGMNRKQGSFGFAGHNDPVQYRNIAIEAKP